MSASLHPLLAAAAAGGLPPWAQAGPGRRSHMERVAGLLDGWSRALDLEDDERARWRAAGWLHDVLREAEPESLRLGVPPTLRDLPGPTLHGPAASARLRREGVEDGAVLDAVAWHTLGHPSLGRLGRAVYAADFLEPGRDLRNEWRAGLRARMPGELDAVVREIVAARVTHQVGKGGRLRNETVAFWNVLVSEAE